MRKLIWTVLAIAGVGVLGSATASAAPAPVTSKSVKQIVDYSEKDLLKLIQTNGQCVTITYNGPNQVATLCPVLSSAPPTSTSPTPSAPTGTPSSTPSPTSTTSSASPTPTSSPSPTQTSSSSQPTSTPTGGLTLPSSIIDLSKWYEGIPVNTSHDGDPDIIRQPELATYVNPDWFRVNPAGDGVQFRVRADGYTTSNSSYPRSELREMADTAGKNLASWNSKVGTNTLSVTESIDAIPLVKPELVAAQIHDASDDVIEIELSGSRLYVKYSDDSKTTTIDPNYVLGTKFSLQLVATAGGIQVWYNGVLSTTINQTGSGWYFKTGAYAQSNVSKGENPATTSQVTIYALGVQHIS